MPNESFKKYMSVGADYVACYNQRSTKKNKGNIKPRSLANLKKSYKSEFLSKGSAKKIKKIIAHWILAINMSQKDQKNRFKKKRRYLVMITLTLPSTQVESDKEIKRKYLNTFLIRYKKKYDEANYLWVAEKQKNGNIHFHIITDNYVDKIWIKSVWNKVLSNGGYIMAFKSKFGYVSPPSTNVTGQKAMSNPANYLIKYVIKAEKTLAIEGVKWACSKELLEIVSISFLCKDWYQEYLHYYRDELKIRYWRNDFVEIYYFDGTFLNDFLAHDLFLDNERQFRMKYSKLFPELKPPTACTSVHNNFKSLTCEQLELSFSNS